MPYIITCDAVQGVEEVGRLKEMALADNMHSTMAAFAVAVIRMDVSGAGLM
jgi:hypothetical protein